MRCPVSDIGIVVVQTAASVESEPCASIDIATSSLPIVGRKREGAKTAAPFRLSPSRSCNHRKSGPMKDIEGGNKTPAEADSFL